MSIGAEKQTRLVRSGTGLDFIRRFPYDVLVLCYCQVLTLLYLRAKKGHEDLPQVKTRRSCSIALTLFNHSDCQTWPEMDDPGQWHKLRGETKHTGPSAWHLVRIP